jgi:hypothetical protein
MIKKIKKHLFKRCLKNNKPLREKQLISLEQVKTMGLVCQITDEDSYKKVYDLFSKLHSPKRSVWLLGYVDERKVPYYCLQQLSADFFSKNELNWFGKPDFAQLNDFLNKEFDILIDLSRSDLAPLHYVLATSKAKLLTGANNCFKDIYDIFIMDEAEMDDLKLLKTIHDYLLKLTGK